MMLSSLPAGATTAEWEHALASARHQPSPRAYAKPAAEKQGSCLDPQALAAAVADSSGPEKPKWERLPSGTPLKVWWAGSEEYFDCKILDWRVGYNDDRQLVYTHRCQYPGGVIEHDLSNTEFEVGDEDAFDYEEEEEEAPRSAASGADDAENRSANTGGGVGLAGGKAARPLPGSPRRKWLQRVEANSPKWLSETSVEEVDVADHGGQARGRVAMRRVRQQAANLLVSPLRRNGAALSKLDSTSMTYRL